MLQKGWINDYYYYYYYYYYYCKDNDDDDDKADDENDHHHHHHLGGANDNDVNDYNYDRFPNFRSLWFLSFKSHVERCKPV